MDSDETRLDWGGGDGDGRVTLEPGARFGQYKVIRELGRGGMGEVYHMEHEVLGREYAIKFIHAEILEEAGALERFRREARVMAGLYHPGILQVDEYGETEGRPWLRMELIQGRLVDDSPLVSLGDLIASRAGQLEEAEVRALLDPLLDALEYAHSRGVVHRDLKPGNILLTESGIKVADFGLVQLAGENWFKDQVKLTVMKSLSLNQEPTVVESGSGSKKGGSARALLGTFDYMSPEQKEGLPIDARSDLYAVGVMAYRMLTGERTLGMRRPSELVDSLDPAWDQWVITAIESDPNRRFASARDMRESLPGVASVPETRGETRTPFSKVFPAWNGEEHPGEPLPDPPHSGWEGTAMPSDKHVEPPSTGGLESILDDLFQPVNEGTAPVPSPAPRANADPPPLPRKRSDPASDSSAPPRKKAARPVDPAQARWLAFCKGAPWYLVGFCILNGVTLVALNARFTPVYLMVFLGALLIQWMGFHVTLHGRIRVFKLLGMYAFVGLVGALVFLGTAMVFGLIDTIQERWLESRWVTFTLIGLGGYVYYQCLKLGYRQSGKFRRERTRLPGLIIPVAILIWVILIYLFEATRLPDSPALDILFDAATRFDFYYHDFMILLASQMIFTWIPLFGLYAALVGEDLGKSEYFNRRRGAA